MRKIQLLLIPITFLILASTSTAWAAKLAKVDVDQTELREGPEGDANVIITLHKGRWLATSNMPVRGFYKVRTAKGVVGWVATSDIVLVDQDKSTPHSIQGAIEESIREESPSR